MRRYLERAIEEFRGLDPATLGRMIAEEMQKAAAASRAFSAATAEPSERSRHQRDLRLASSRETALQYRAAIDFGASRGWKWTDSTFGILTLAAGKHHNGRDWTADWPVGSHQAPRELFDHPYHYRRGRKTAAIVVHLYGRESVKPKVEAYAAANGLRVEFPTDFPSWWNPGSTMLVVYTGPGAFDLCPLCRKPVIGDDIDGLHADCWQQLQQEAADELAALPQESPFVDEFGDWL